jgi:hypothetical protein
MAKTQSSLIGKLMKNAEFKKLLKIGLIVIAAIFMLRFIIGMAFFGKFFQLASNHLEYVEKEKKRISNGIDDAEEAMHKAHDGVWTAVEEGRISRDLSDKIEQVDLDRQLEKYRNETKKEVDEAIDGLKEGGRQREAKILKLIALHTSNIESGIRYKIDTAIALKRQIPELKAELAVLEKLANPTEREERRKNAIINYLNDIKPEDLSEDMDYWLEKSRAEKPGCNDRYVCKDKAMSVEYLKILIPAMEAHIQAGHFVHAKVNDTFSTTHNYSVKELLTDARASAGLPYEPMIKEQRALALEEEKAILHKMDEEQKNKQTKK